MKKLGILESSIGIVLGLFLTWLFFLNHVGVNEIGIAYNSQSGKIVLQSEPGWYVTSPLTRSISLSILPITAHLPTAANCITTKIVRLKPNKVLDLIKLQGFGLGLSLNFDNIMMGFAFSGQTYSFLEIIQQGSIEVQ